MICTIVPFFRPAWVFFKKIYLHLYPNNPDISHTYIIVVMSYYIIFTLLDNFCLSHHDIMIWSWLSYIHLLWITLPLVSSEVVMIFLSFFPYIFMQKVEIILSWYNISLILNRYFLFNNLFKSSFNNKFIPKLSPFSVYPWYI